MLGHALREVWLRREGRTITLAGYRASGGVRSAISATAEQALAALDEEGQAVARRLLLRMVELRPDGDDARRWVSHREISEIDPTRAPDVVATLAGARLLVVDRDQVTVVHEALLRAWPRLGGWIAEQRADLFARQEVRWAAERWAEGGRTEGDLYRDSRLDAALDLTAREPLPGREAEFVEAGRLLRDREQSDAKRRTRRLRVLATVTSVLAVIALVVGAIAVLQRNDARNARVAADEAATIADAVAPVPRHWRSGRTTAPCCSRLRGSTCGTAPRQRGNVLNTIERNPQALGVIRNGQPRLVGVDSAPAGHQAMVLDGRDEVTLYDMSTRQAVTSLAKAGTSYPVADFSPDGDVVAVSSFSTECLGSEDCADAAVEVFDARDLSPRRPLRRFPVPGSRRRLLAGWLLARRDRTAPMGEQWRQHRRLAGGRPRRAGETSQSAGRRRETGPHAVQPRIRLDPVLARRHPLVRESESARRSPSTWPPVKRWPASTGSVRSPSAPMGRRSRST